MAYGELVATLRSLLDLFADAAPDEELSSELTRALSEVNEQLRRVQVDDAEHRLFGRCPGLPNRGTTLVPVLEYDLEEPGRATGRVTFGPYFQGAPGTVHGGVIPLVLDHIAGSQANAADEPLARTARLTTSYRSLTRVGRELRFETTHEGSEGRKRFWTIRLWDGDTLCAETEMLMVVPRSSPEATP